MDKQELIRRLMRTFLGELEGHLQAFDRDLMTLENASGPEVRAETINSLFRTAHSLKGSARAVNVEILETTAHRLEFIFGEARDRSLVFSPGIFELLFRAVDGIKAVKAQLDEQKDVDRAPLAALVAELQTTFDEPGAALAEKPSAPAKPTVSAAQEPAVPAFPVPDFPVPEPSVEPASVEAKPHQPSAQVPAARDPASQPIVRQRSRDEFVRVSSSKLDRMVALGGELLVARRRTASRRADLDLLFDKARKLDAGWRSAERSLREADRAGRKAGASIAKLESARRTMAAEHEKLQSLLWQLSEFSTGLMADLRALDQVAEPLEDEITNARMMPFTTVCDGLGRALRDVAHETGKEAILVIEGGDLELSRSIAEAVRDPLLHLIRNAVDHGIESPAARIAAGKSPRGRVTVSATPRNGGIEIVVADDGGGFDLAAIRAQARKRGLAVPEDDREAAGLVFAPGFSTTTDVTVISGRGVGLDLVRNAVEAKRGRVDVQTTPGAGSRFTITMPFSLSMLPVLLVEAGGQTYGFDCAAVVGLRRIGVDAIHAVGGRDTILFEDVPVPLLSLAESLDGAAQEPPQAGGKVPVVILSSGADRVAFVVEELLAEQVVVVKDLGSRLRSVRGINGATILPTGRIALVLNAADLVAMARTRAPSQAMSLVLDVGPVETRKRLLVVDDSITTRTLVQSILESTGFDVMAAVDGMEAWRMLQERGADLVVSDIEMPRMDGFALTEAIRTSRRFRDLPVILVTALESEEDKMRGLDAGADAYLRKSSFDQSQLIDTIRQLL